MNKVLVVGCKGQLGTDCMSVLGSEVVGIDLPKIDISNRSECLATLDALAPDVIVNCAAYTAVDACETDPSCWKVNADGPKHLAEWTEASRSFLIHVSTDYVFAGDKPLFEAALETEFPEPISEYGKSKLAGEQAISMQTDRFATLRTAWLYGATGNNFLKTMLRLTLQNPEKEFKVVNDQYGSPTWSHTLARQIWAVAEQQSVGIFHATSEGYCTWYELACVFLETLGVEHHFVPCSADEFPAPARRPGNSILENACLKELGINLFGDWREDLFTYVEQHGGSIIKEIRAL